MLNLRALTVTAAILAAAPLAHAQKATEIYIPIGMSPGLSGKSTLIGTITEVDEETRTMTVRAASRTWKAQMDEDTRIYLDRSRQRKKNLYGTEADCRPGVRVEVNYVSHERIGGGTIEWIKIDAATLPRNRGRR